jgi:maleylacetate reductase
MRPFVYNALPARVVFGVGTIGQVADEVRGLGCRRALILSTPQQQSEAERLASQIGDLAAGVFAGAVMHTPVEVTEQAMVRLRDLGADCTIALGGGSTIGLGKAIALRSDLPQIVIPTTYAGSEATPILGETEKGRKTTQHSLKVLPEVIVYDVDLTLTLPPGLTATSGINAMAHAVEALYAQDANPVTSLLAEQAIGILAQALPRIVKTLGIARLAQMRCTAPGRAARASDPLAWRCIIRFATCSEAASGCRTPKPTPSCCLMPLPSMRRRLPKRWSASRMRLRRPTPRKGCLI